jgi:hypothetical protein
MNDPAQVLAVHAGYSSAATRTSSFAVGAAVVDGGSVESGVGASDVG